MLAAGVFQPRGTSGMMGASGAAGLGTDNVAGMALGTLGILGAGHATAAVEHEPRWTIVAVTPTRILAFEGLMHGMGSQPGSRYAAFDRASLAVTVHGRVNVRVMVLEDLSDHRRLELETARFGPQHGTVLTHILAEDARGPEDTPAS